MPFSPVVSKTVSVISTRIPRLPPACTQVPVDCCEYTLGLHICAVLSTPHHSFSGSMGSDHMPTAEPHLVHDILHSHRGTVTCEFHFSLEFLLRNHGDKRGLTHRDTPVSHNSWLHTWPFSSSHWLPRNRMLDIFFLFLPVLDSSTNQNHFISFVYLVFLGKGCASVTLQKARLV